MKTNSGASKIQNAIKDLQKEICIRKEKHESEIAALVSKMKELEWKLSCYDMAEEDSFQIKKTISPQKIITDRPISSTIATSSNQLYFRTFQNLPVPSKFVSSMKIENKKPLQNIRSSSLNKSNLVWNHVRTSREKLVTPHFSSSSQSRNIENLSKNSSKKISKKTDDDSDLKAILFSRFSSDVPKETYDKLLQLIKHCKTTKTISLENSRFNSHSRSKSREANKENKKQKTNDSKEYSLDKNAKYLMGTGKRFDFSDQIKTPKFHDRRERSTVKECLEFSFVRF